mgnify:CR=1 FL=1
MLESQPSDYVDRYQAIKAAGPCGHLIKDALVALNQEFEYAEDLHR